MFERKTFKNHYEGAIEPFKIIGNTYFVGTFPASSCLIDTGDGLILIDTGYADTLFLLINSIYKLGFSPYDVKYIIHTHWHWDHTEAIAAFVHLTGANTYIGKKDAPKPIDARALKGITIPEELSAILLKIDALKAELDLKRPLTAGEAERLRE